jgi:hypothetical protein
LRGIAYAAISDTYAQGIAHAAQEIAENARGSRESFREVGKDDLTQQRALASSSGRHLHHAEMMRVVLLIKLLCAAL